MKNNLWIFGCSFSTGHNHNIDNGYPIEVTWPYILSKKLNLELVNKGKSAQSNWGNILEFVKYRDQITKDDIVIFEFTFFDRLSIYPHTIIMPDELELFIQRGFNGDLEFYLSIIRNNNFDWFNKEVNQYCKSNSLQIHYWSVEGDMHNEFTKYKNTIPFMKAPNAKYGIFSEWQDLTDNQWIDDYDRHFNELGHTILAEHFFKSIYEK